jgi:hypothetical protein
MKDYRQQIAEYDRDIEQANGTGDTPKAESLGRERQEVIDRLKADTGLGGNSRTLGPVNPDKSAENAVRNAITRARRKIAKRMPKLEAHLKESVVIGKDCAYRPTSSIAWELD